MARRNSTPSRLADWTVDDAPNALPQRARLLRAAAEGLRAATVQASAGDTGVAHLPAAARLTQNVLMRREAAFQLGAALLHLYVALLSGAAAAYHFRRLLGGTADDPVQRWLGFKV